MGKPDRSCRICGYFVKNETVENANAGYCLCYDDEQSRGESLKIPVDEEKETATDCSGYFRNVMNLKPADFIAWRGSIETLQIQRGWQETGEQLSRTAAELSRTATRWTVFAGLIAGASFLLGVADLLRGCN